MLEKIRTQPDQVKERVALGLAIAIFLIVLAVWVSSFSARSQEGETREKSLSPLAGVGEVFGGITTDVKAVFSSPASSTSDNMKIASSTPSTSPRPRLEAIVLEAVSVVENPSEEGSETDFDISGIVVIDSNVATSTKPKK